MGLRLAFVLLGVLAVGLPAWAQDSRPRQPKAVTAAPRVVYRPALARPAPQTYPLLFPMTLAPLPGQQPGTVRVLRSRAAAKGAKGVKDTDAKESKGTQSAKDSSAKDSKDTNETKDAKGTKDTNETKDAKGTKDTNETKDAKEIKDAKETKETEGARDIKGITDARDTTNSTDAKDTEAVKSTKGAKETTDTQRSSTRSTSAGVSETDQLTIQSNLALIGDYEGAPGNFDEGTIAAVKAFQQRHHNKATGVLAAPERDALAAAAKGPAAAVGWRLIEDTKTGARLGLPEKLVPKPGTSSRSGSRWTSAQGQIQIETFRYTEAALPALFEDEKKTAKRRITASALKAASFIISGVQGLKNFIVRAQASGSEVRGITILYDQATEGIMGTVATATAGAFQGFPDARAAPPPGTRRSVEYATAIVASAAGDLIAPGRATEACRSLVVPGLGHAERIAADETNDLALLRLYGARNLVPVALGGDSGKGDVLTLVGVADPLAQAGAAAVTSVAARRSGQGVEPVPRLGFAGAAAVDAQGRFAGMVDLRSPATAGGGSVLPLATLVPADALRGFLATQGIKPETAAAPATDHAAIEKSVVRVICVRK
jgi:peptidoglycan hydrolase-like protein with peptidoglycan-binding domain